MKRFLMAIALMSAILCTNSCNDESFTTSPSSQPKFSKDTIQFDTLFTGVPSADRVLMVYNPHKKSLEIESVTLLNAPESGYLMSVDGFATNQYKGLIIDPKDSIYIRVRIYPKDLDQNGLRTITDNIEFITNGVRQQVVLTAHGMDAWKWQGKNLSKDTTLTAERPFIIYDSLVVARGVKLTIEAGTQLHFHDKAYMRINGSLVTNGTIAEPVIFRGDRLDNMFPDLPYDYLSGQWGGVYISGNSQGNSLNNTIIRGGKWGIQIDSVLHTNQSIKLFNTAIHNVAGIGLGSINARIEATNSRFTNAKVNCINILGGEAQFTHCTIANYYSWESRQGEALSIGNYQLLADKSINPYPITNTEFDNCIIYGSRSPEVVLRNTYKNEMVNASFDVKFQACLIRAKSSTVGNFFETVWNEDPKFVGTGSNYIYNFHIDTLSAAIGKANLIYTEKVPYDADNNYRLTDNKPDIGAYQFIPRK